MAFANSSVAKHVHHIIIISNTFTRITWIISTIANFWCHPSLWKHNYYILILPKVSMSLCLTNDILLNEFTIIYWANIGLTFHVINSLTLLQLKHNALVYTKSAMNNLHSRRIANGENRKYSTITRNMILSPTFMNMFKFNCLIDGLKEIKLCDAMTNLQVNNWVTYFPCHTPPVKIKIT